MTRHPVAYGFYFIICAEFESRPKWAVGKIIKNADDWQVGWDEDASEMRDVDTESGRDSENISDPHCFDTSRCFAHPDASTHNLCAASGSHSTLNESKPWSSVLWTWMWSSRLVSCSWNKRVPPNLVIQCAVVAERDVHLWCPDSQWQRTKRGPGHCSMFYTPVHHSAEIEMKASKVPNWQRFIICFYLLVYL